MRNFCEFVSIPVFAALVKSAPWLNITRINHHINSKPSTSKWQKKKNFAYISQANRRHVSFFLHTSDSRMCRHSLYTITAISPHKDLSSHKIYASPQPHHQLRIYITSLYPLKYLICEGFYSPHMYICVYLCQIILCMCGDSNFSSTLLRNLSSPLLVT